MKVKFDDLLVLNKRKIIYVTIFGVLLFLCSIIGEIVYTKGANLPIGQGEIKQWGYFIFKIIVTFIASVGVFYGIASVRIETKIDDFFCGWKFFVGGWILMFLCYVPALISFFPGLLAYDSQWQTYQIYGIYPMTNHHPILHTYLWKLFLKIGELLGQLEVGIMFYGIFQTLLMTSVFMFFVVWIGKRVQNRAIQILSYIFFACNPTFHLLVIQSDKDVLFGGFFLLWTMHFIDAILDKKISGKLMCTTVLACAFRHNGFYAMLVLFMAMLFFCMVSKNIRGKYKKVLMVVGIGLLVYYVGLKIILSFMDISGASIREMMSVPCSQLSSVYLEEVYENPNRTLSEEDSQLILKYIPNCESYNMRLSDFVKGNFNEAAFKENPGEFIWLWLRCLVRYPVRYVYAYAQLTIYYWCPTALEFPDIYSGEAYIQSVRRDVWEAIEIVDWNLLPAVREFYHSVGGFDNLFMRFPVISFFFSLSFPLFMIIFVLYRILYRKEYNKFVYILLPGIYMCTLLVGPVCNYRYIFPIILLTPLMFCFMCIEKHVKETTP